MKEKRISLIFKSKKSQLSPWIMISIVIVVFVIAYFINKKYPLNGFGAEDREKINSILSSIENCKSIAADEAVYKIGIQGGYKNPPETYLDLGWSFIPYYFIEGDIVIPKKSDIEKNVGVLFDSLLDYCSNLIDKGNFSLKVLRNPSIVQISPGKVSFNIQNYYILEKEGRSTKFDFRDKIFTKNYKLNEMYEIAEYITDSHRKDPSLLCMSCLVDMAKEKELLVDFIEIENTTRLVVITDLNKTSEYFYQFINKYKEKESKNNDISISIKKT